VGSHTGAPGRDDDGGNSDSGQLEILRRNSAHESLPRGRTSDCPFTNWSIGFALVVSFQNVRFVVAGDSKGSS